MSEYSPERGISTEPETIADAYFSEDPLTDRISLNLTYVVDGEMRAVSIVDWFTPQIVSLESVEGDL